MKHFVTGGTGSFGSYLVNEILKYGPKRIIIYSRDEDKQYSMQHDLQKYNSSLRFVIGDVRDKESILKSSREGIDILIHAAAMKQIPSTEYNILEAVKTNVLGAQNVVDACIINGIKKALLISTDKAVEPVNTMGITKALQERIFTLANKRGKEKSKFSSVRYGNLVASRGSVIPLFVKQIKDGGPVTLTHNEMTRFIFTLEEAINLVFNALSTMVGGEVFVPKTRPLKVIDLAKVLIDELKPKNKRIVEIGIRPGEKLHETLISPMESLKTVEKKMHYVVLPQIELKKIGHTYKVPTYKKEVFRYSSDKGPFLTKAEIRNILKKERIL